MNCWSNLEQSGFVQQLFRLIMSYFKYHFLNFQTWLMIRDVLLSIQDFPVRKTNTSTSFMNSNSFGVLLVLGSEDCPLYPYLIQQQVLVFTPQQWPWAAVPCRDISTLTPALSTATLQGARSIHCGNNAQNYAQIQYTPKTTSPRMKLAML